MLTWQTKSTTHTSSEVGGVGKWGKIFTFHWDGVSGANHPDGPYVLYSHLPGIKSNLGHFRTPEDCKKKAETIMEHWIKGAGLMRRPE